LSTSATLSGNTVTLSTAPTSNQAVYVEYVYGVHASNYSTLAYQQSSAGDGGLNSMMIDDGFPSRYLGKFTSMGYDWLYGYPGFTSTFKNQVATMLVRWSDISKDTVYRVDDPASNYAEGNYVSRVLTALALGGGRNTNGARLINEAIATTSSVMLATSIGTAIGGLRVPGSAFAQHLTLRGLQPFMRGAGPFRLLRIRVDSRRSGCALMTSIGHELQHAIEVLSDPHVTDMHTMYWFFERRGSGGPVRFETEAAIHVGRQVEKETCGR
jgi:hypothetical protein